MNVLPTAMRAGTNWVALSEPARDVKKRRRAQRGKCGEHVQVCYSHLHHTASSLSKWEEQRRPQQACQPLMFSHHSDGHPKQQWCALLWAFWIFQDALGWHCDSPTTRKCHSVFFNQQFKQWGIWRRLKYQKRYQNNKILEKQNKIKCLEQ